MVDMKKMRKGYEENQRGGDMIQFDPGETLVYIHPECRKDDTYEPTAGVNFVPVVVHYGIGKNRGMAVSLDPESNPIITHPFVKAFLKKKKVRLTGKCPVKAALEKGDIDDDAADEMRPQTKFIWGMTIIAHRNKASEEWRRVSPKPGIYMAGKTVFDGIMEAFFDNGDITDPDGAILLKIGREGKGMTTKYTVKVDATSLKKPFKLGPKFKAILSKALAEGGDCDLFRFVSNMVKSPSEVQALLAGVKVSDDADDIDDIDDDDEESLDEDESDEDEDDAPPPKKSKAHAKAKSKSKPKDDEDDEDEDDDPLPPEDDDEDDEDDEAELDDSDDSADDDEDDDEDVPAPKKPASKPKAAPAKAKKAPAKPTKDDDDEDDLGLDDLESALDELDDDDDDEPPAKTAKKGAKK